MKRKKLTLRFKAKLLCRRQRVLKFTSQLFDILFGLFFNNAILFFNIAFCHVIILHLLFVSFDGIVIIIISVDWVVFHEFPLMGL